jgi:tRNA (mo5U34)-methyltransferase
MAFDTETAMKLIAGRPWHHDFEIVPGVRTNGTYDPSQLWNMLDLPADLSGMSVADVGASNGYFSFEARKRGARVVAFDFRHKDNSGFGLAQHINGMTDIEHHQINVLEISRREFGRFDVVLALGLLYHVADPYRALANCAQIAEDRLLVESYCIDSSLGPELANEPVMRFISDPVRFPGPGNLANDRSNFWGFTSTCLRRMAEDVEFGVARIDVFNDRVFLDARRSPEEGRARLSLAYDCVPAVPAQDERNLAESWVVF